MYKNWRWLALGVDGIAWAINENSTASNRKIMINGSEFFQSEIIFFISYSFLTSMAWMDQRTFELRMSIPSQHILYLRLKTIEGFPKNEGARGSISGYSVLSKDPQTFIPFLRRIKKAIMATIRKVMMIL